MPLGGLYGVLLGYLVTKKAFIGRRSMELVSMVNYALPGTIVVGVTPAATFRLRLAGRWNWWPSSLGRGDDVAGGRSTEEVSSMPTGSLP